MWCKCCNKRPVARGKKELKIPHKDGKKGKYTIVHEDEDMCSVCIGYSQNYSSEDEEINFSELGVDIPEQSFDYDNM